MAQYKDFLDTVNAIVPGVARPLVTPLIPQVVKTFCERSRIWREDMSVTLTRDEVKAPVDVNACCRVQLSMLDAALVDVVGLAHNGQGIPATDYSRRARKGFVFRRHYPAGDYIATLALAPSRDATEIPDLLVDHWQEVIAYGIAYKLAMQPNKDWSNVNLAQEYQRLFTQGCNTALFEANNDRQSVRTGGQYTFY